MSIQQTIQWYHDNAAALASRYVKADADQLHRWFADLLPEKRGSVIDIGAGMGRDANWFARLGFQVLAVEPAAAMRAQGASIYGDSIQWLDDRLPTLAGTLKAGASAEVVFLGAVWMHVAPNDRPRAFRKLVSLTKSGGLILFSIRLGADDGRGFHPASAAEIERLAGAHGLSVVRVRRVPDSDKRPDVEWDCIALRVPDDGTSALPLMRHLILHDDKTFTYKLGLLRALCRVAADAAGLATDDGADTVVVPLGIVAAYWLRLYIPLLENKLPQRGGRQKIGTGLGFVTPDGVGKMKTLKTAEFRLRIGARFTGEEAAAVHAAMCAAAATIKKNPAHFTKYPNSSEPIFDCRQCNGDKAENREVIRSDELTLDSAYLGKFGKLRIHRDIWRALQRFGHWIEPSLIAEWIGMMKEFAQRRPGDNKLDEGHIAVGMTWRDPERDTNEVRDIVQSRLEAGLPVECVWTGEKVTPRNFDVDHCFPWSAWPCSDLWNLAPAIRSVNRDSKRHKIPSEQALVAARVRFLEWWKSAYLDAPREGLLPIRFRTEALSSLPALEDDRLPDPEAIHRAMRVQRLRLWSDQRIPEWDGP